MKTWILPAEDPEAIGAALSVMRSGGLVAFPTDTVYGLGAILFDDKAVESIYVAKGRSGEKAIPVLISDAAELDRVAKSIPRMARRLADRFWPGPLTLIVKKKPAVPLAVSSTETVGVRVPDHAATRALLRASGPLAVTSANISGQPSPSTAQEVLDQLDGRIALILDGGKTPGGVPSTVVDCLQSEPVILRVGPLSLDDIRTAL
jgi:L-threonylcarbamoyladenylate synthase